MQDSLQLAMDANGKVSYTQSSVNPPTVVPEVLGKLDGAYQKPGATMLHEVTESYIGGKMSQQAGVSSGDAATPGSVYPAAHAAASPQAGPYSTRSFDKSGNRMNPSDAAAHPERVGRTENYVRDNSGNAQVIQTIGGH